MSKIFTKGFKSKSTTKEAKKIIRNEIVTKKADDLRLGKVVCVLKNRNTGRIREVEGSVARVPYNSKATKETKRKFGKNSLLKGTNLQEGATMIERNQQIGGSKCRIML